MRAARDTKPRWVVPVRDDALRDVSRSDMREYIRTRDLSVLGIDMKTGIVQSNGEPVTLYKVEPLKQLMANLSDPEARSRNNLTAVFATHVSEAINTPVHFEREDGRLNDRFMESVPLDDIEEIATVIIELATGGGRGATIPFSSPVGFWADRSNSMEMLAKAAKILEGANQDTGTSRTTEGSTPAESSSPSK